MSGPVPGGKGFKLTVSIVALASDTALLVQLHIGWWLLLSKGYKHIDRDARQVWDRRLKERVYEGHRLDCGGDDNGQGWARLMSGQVVRLG